MDIVISTSNLLFTLLIFVRISTFFVLLPVINFIKLPVMIRIFLALALSVFIKSAILNSPTDTLSIDYSYIKSLLIEVVNGAALAFGAFVAFATFQLAGRVIDFQMGLAVANQVDPITQSQSPLVGTLLFMLGSIVFVLAGGIEVIIKILILGFQAYTPGSLNNNLTFSMISDHFGLMFSIAVVLIAPVIVTLFLIDIAMAFSSRFMPQMNVFILSIPLKVAIGFSVLAISVVWMRPIFEKIFNHLFAFWFGLM